MNHLILVRHSIPEVDPAIPSREWQLSETGKIRCKALAEHLAAYSPDVFISSTEPKAVETAKLASDYLKKPCSTFEGLHEHDRTGVGYANKVQFIEWVKAFFETPDKLIFGRETANQSFARFSEALAKVETRHPNQNIVVVSHGTVMSLFVSRFNPIDAFSFWQKLDMPALVVLSLPQYQLITAVETVT